MQAVETGPIENWFPEKEVEPVPYSKAFEGARWEPLCVLHTSGSTGIPKPIVVRHGMIAINDMYNTHNKPDWKGRKIFVRGFSEDSKRNFLTSASTPCFQQRRGRLLLTNPSSAPISCGWIIQLPV